MAGIQGQRFLAGTLSLEARVWWGTACGGQERSHCHVTGLGVERGARGQSAGVVLLRATPCLKRRVLDGQAS